MTARRLFSAIVLVALLVSCAPGRAVTPSSSAPAWASPPTMTLKRIAAVTGPQNEPAYLSNLDCTLEEYRLVASGTLQTGCFTDSAFGQIDADSDVVIFNGTDEGLPLLPSSTHQVLVPWPKALNLVTLDATNTGGSYINLYKNPLASLHDQRNLLGQLTAKQLTAPPDIPLKNSLGQPLVINAQSLAYSDNGSWLVVEVLGGAFTRINLATLEQLPFGPVYARQGSAALDESSVTISADGRYVAVENTYASEFKVYDLANCAGTICASYNYWPFIKNQLSSLMYVSHVRFVNGGLLSFDATTKDTNSGGTYELAPTAGIRSLIDYLGLGDSYSSGQGAFDYLSGTDSANNQCHLSSHAYPLLLAHDLFTAAGGHAVACSGAVMHDIGDTGDGYRGQVRGVANWRDLTESQPALLASIMANYLPGYVAQQRFVGQYQPAIMTVGIGGNNMGFGNILERCIAPQTSLHTVANTCFATYEDRQEIINLVNKTGKGLQQLYQQLLKQDPGVALYVIGYPQISVDTGSCALNVHFNTSELEFATELVNQINGVIAKAATAAGAHYVDISLALAGHRLCESASSNIAVNGLTAGNDIGIGDFGVLGQESYHPNALGQQLIEQAILKQTNNLRLPATAVNPTVQAPSPDFANLPKTGRTVTQLLPAKGITNTKAKPGQTLALTVDGVAYGLSLADNYSVRLDGSQGTVIGNSGGGSGSVTLPGSTVPGIHTVDVTGQNQAGEAVDISQPILVTTDKSGSCAPVADSGIDSDRDGLDDACDPLIAAVASGDAGSGVRGGSSSSTLTPAALSVVRATGGGDPLGQSDKFVTLAGQAPPAGTVLAATTLQPYKRLPGLPVIQWLWWLLLAVAVVLGWYGTRNRAVQA